MDEIVSGIKITEGDFVPSYQKPTEWQYDVSKRIINTLFEQIVPGKRRRRLRQSIIAPLKNNFKLLMKSIGGTAVGLEFQEDKDEDGTIDQLTISNNIATIHVIYEGPMTQTLNIRLPSATTPMDNVADVVLRAISASVDGMDLGSPPKQPLSAPDNVYVYGGHGSDICDASGNVVTSTVPEGCVYITIAECGLPTFDTESVKMVRALVGQGSVKLPDDLFSSIPFTDDKRALLAKAMGVEPSVLHVHNPGDDYVVSSFYPTAHWYRFSIPSDKLNMMAESGLMTANKLNCIKSVGSVRQPLFNINSTMGTPLTPRFLLLNDVKAELLKLADRPFLHAIIEKGLLDGILKEQLNMYQITTYIPKDKYKQIIANLSEYIDHDTLLAFFCASVCPTPEQVKGALAKYENPIHFGHLQQLMEDIKKVIQPQEASEVTSAFLMEKFPGVHLNMVCRVVDKSCEPAAEARRSVSRGRYGTLRAGKKKNKKKNKTKKRFHL